MILKFKKPEDIKTLSNLDDQYSMKLKYPSFDQFIESNFDI